MNVPREILKQAESLPRYIADDVQDFLGALSCSELEEFRIVKIPIEYLRRWVRILESGRHPRSLLRWFPWLGRRPIEVRGCELNCSLIQYYGHSLREGIRDRVLRELGRRALSTRRVRR